MKNNLDEIIKERLVNLILKLYFLPYNTMKYFTYRCDCHKFEMLETEIKMLKKVRESNNEQSQ